MFLASSIWPQLMCITSSGCLATSPWWKRKHVKSLKQFGGKEGALREEERSKYMHWRRNGFLLMDSWTHSEKSESLFIQKGLRVELLSWKKPIVVVRVLIRTWPRCLQGMSKLMETLEYSPNTLIDNLIEPGNVWLDCRINRITSFILFLSSYQIPTV